MTPMLTEHQMFLLFFKIFYYTYPENMENGFDMSRQTK